MKRTLLYTYFTTLASLVLCCAMFLGTTMAWFSSDVTNTGNVIQVGTLAAEMYHVVPASEPILLNDKSDYQVFDLSQKWSPTTEQTQTLKVVNKGDLNFKYDLSLLLTSVNAAGTGTELTAEKQAALLSNFEVKVRVHDGTASVSDDSTEWKVLGTLDQFLNPVSAVDETEGDSAEGSGTDVAADAFREIRLYSGMLQPNVTIENGTAAGGCVHYIDVAISMKDTTSTDLMGQSFTISVKLAATQLTADETVGE